MNSAYSACLETQLSIQIFLQQTFEEITHKWKINFATKLGTVYVVLPWGE